MFEQIDALPGAKRDLTVDNRNGKRCLKQRGLYMRWHIIRTFGAVDKIGHARIIRGWHKPFKKGIQVALHIRVGILLNHQGTGRVLAEKGEESGRQVLSAHKLPNTGRYFIEAWTCR